MAILVKLLKGTPKKLKFIILNISFHSDPIRWHQFLESWNGVSMVANSVDSSLKVYCTQMPQVPLAVAHGGALIVSASLA